MIRCYSQTESWVGAGGYYEASVASCASSFNQSAESGGSQEDRFAASRKKIHDELVDEQLRSGITTSLVQRGVYRLNKLVQWVLLGGPWKHDRIEL